MTPQVIAAYVGIGVTFLLGVAALVISVFSLAIQRESARAATIAAEEARRSNWLTEQRLNRESSAPFATRAEPIAGSPPDVRWLLTRRGKNTYVLRNVGSVTATHVRVVPESVGAVHRNLPEDATVRPQESVGFLLIGTWGSEVPNEILVASEGHETDPQVVPVPA